ncbi:MAG: hypothetical protein QM645_10135 [Asticcacaulis sp.]
MRKSRRHAPEEGESFYITMTDLMVGVVFIFIILLAYLAFNFRDSTEALTSAHDAQTVALLQKADALENRQAPIRLDRKNHIVCLPGEVLETGPDERCFAYTPQSQSQSEAGAAKPEAQRAEADKAAFMVSLDESLRGEAVPAQTDIGNGVLRFEAPELFEGETSRLSARGRETITRVAGKLAASLPCYADGASEAGCDLRGNMAVVNIVGHAQYNAFTPEGRARQALALERSVVFHETLVSAQPVLGQLRNRQDARPLLRIETHGQSVEDGNSPQSISVYFHMAP